VCVKKPCPYIVKRGGDILWGGSGIYLGSDGSEAFFWIKNKDKMAHSFVHKEENAMKELLKIFRASVKIASNYLPKIEIGFDLNQRPHGVGYEDGDERMGDGI
jgi:UDP-N-acetylglucosamine 2-epimerase